MRSRRTTAVVIGAGPAGLATSSCLARQGVDHVVLERGEVAHSWRTQRWDSLRLLTPNWMNRLPGLDGVGREPDGYMTSADLVAHLDDLRFRIAAPVVEHTTVTAVRPGPSGFTVDTNSGPWRSRAVIVASGAASVPRVPAVAGALPSTIHQINALEYRNPDALHAGDVLVVGASASGVQIADELRRAGHEVTLAVGDHVRLPRTYRGRDIYHWMAALGLLDELHDQVDDLARARRLPSPQLVGTPQRRSLDLNALHAGGVEVTGRLVGVSGRRAQFSGSLANLTASADLKLSRLLDRIDRHLDAGGQAPGDSGDAGDVRDPGRPLPTRLPVAANEMPLARYVTVVWATGHRPAHPFLDGGLLDRRGRLRHDGGVTEVPGLYVLGLPVLRRRGSTFLYGIAADARELTDHLVARLPCRAPAA